MLEFSWPWLLLLLPLPWLVRRWLSPLSDRRDPALRVPFFEDFLMSSRTSASSPTPRRWLWLAVPAWVLLVLAGARPQWLGETEDLPVGGRNLMLAVDLSRSMEQTDFEIHGDAVNRLQAVKYVAGDFIDRRQGDRVGLILFGARAYVQAPLTHDRTTVKTLLNESEIGLAGDATAIGDAIGVAIKRLREHSSRDQVLILLTDGANTAGELDPLKAAELAAKIGLRIYTIGIGADQSTWQRFFGLNRGGNSDLDEKTLKAIADISGGRYFRAADGRQLDHIYALLDELEPTEEQKRYRVTTLLFPYPLSVALLLSVLLVFRLRREDYAR